MIKEIITQDGKEIIYEESFWLGKRAITIDGKQLSKVSKNIYTDGNIDYKIKGNQFFGLSIVDENNDTYIIYEKLNVYEIILACIPLIMVFIGGAIGGALGALGFFLIILIIRKNKNILINILSSLIISGLVFGIWYILAQLINSVFLV